MQAPSEGVDGEDGRPFGCDGVDGNVKAHFPGERPGASSSWDPVYPITALSRGWWSIT
jgi:hypothetical protein